jgi:hypothetical protein
VVARREDFNSVCLGETADLPAMTYYCSSLADGLRQDKTWNMEHGPNPESRGIVIDGQLTFESPSLPPVRRHRACKK